MGQWADISGVGVGRDCGLLSKSIYFGYVQTQRNLSLRIDKLIVARGGLGEKQWSCDCKIRMFS